MRQLLIGVVVVLSVCACASSDDAVDTTDEGVEEAPPSTSAAEDGTDDSGTDGVESDAAATEVVCVTMPAFFGGNAESLPGTLEEVIELYDEATADAPAELAASLAVVRDALFASVDPESLSEEEVRELTEEYEAAHLDVAEWLTRSCDLDAPLWACVAQETFEPVGMSFDSETGSTFDPEAGGGAESPEDAIDVEGLVEVERDDDRVVFVELDDMGLAVHRWVVVRAADGTWIIDVNSRCPT